VAFVLALVGMGLAMFIAHKLLSRNDRGYQKPTPLTASEIEQQRAANRATQAPALRELKPKRIWNASELAMYHRLSEALPDHIILAEVGYQAFLSAGNDKSLQGQIKSRRLDFVVLTQGGDFVAGVELDGSSHDNDKAAATDHRKNLLMASAGLRLIRWPADSIPKGPEIVARVLG